MKSKLFESGSFFIGVNYWASYAGTNMWRDWRENEIESDLKILAENNVKILRVFPLWEDFQPITKLLGGLCELKEISHGERFLDKKDKADSAGVSKVMIERFRKLCRMATENGLQLIVSLINGWMSGRSFIPPAFMGLNVITDTFCVKWEIKYVKFFVSQLKDENCIIAWEAGNECNCLAKVNTESDAWVWTSAITDAVRTADDSRPIISGMHGLYGGTWKIEGQAENCDILTVHPYMLFTPYCSSDGLISPKAVLHAAAEMTWYSDLGKKPCLLEEIGSLSSIMGDDETVADFVRVGLFDSWAHNGLGFMWWCAFDQINLSHAPYDWCDVERELGIFRNDGSPKLLAKELAGFSNFLKSLPFTCLPERRRDAVCIVNEGLWKLVFGSFLLAKRAGIELIYSDKDSLPEDAKLYFIPGSESVDFLSKRLYDDLICKVEKGANIFITYDSNIIGGFEKLVGCRSKGRVAKKEKIVVFQGKEIVIPCAYSIRLVPVTAEILAYDKEGVPVFTSNRIGKGRVYFFNAPLESYTATVENQTAQENFGLEVFYKYVAEKTGIKGTVSKTSALLDVTEHKINDEETLIIAINNTNHRIIDQLLLNGVKFNKQYYGKAESKNDFVSVEVKSADAVVFSVKNI